MSKTDAHIHIPDFRSTAHKAPRKGVPEDEDEDEFDKTSETAPENDAVDVPRHKPSRHGPEKNTRKETHS